MKDCDLAKKVKDDTCSESLVLLIQNNAALCCSIFKKYSSTMKILGYQQEDFNGDRDFVVNLSAQSFNPDKGCKFSTWAGNRMRFFCLNFISKNKRHPLIYRNSLQKEVESVCDEKDGFAESKDTQVCNLMRALKDCPERRAHQVFEMRYISSGRKKKKFALIAEELGVSSQTAINIHSRGINFLKKKLTSEMI